MSSNTRIKFSLPFENYSHARSACGGISLVVAIIDVQIIIIIIHAPILTRDEQHRKKQPESRMTVTQNDGKKKMLSALA